MTLAEGLASSPNPSMRKTAGLGSAGYVGSGACVGRETKKLTAAHRAREAEAEAT
jgi:hypothetical protein